MRRRTMLTGPSLLLASPLVASTLLAAGAVRADGDTRLERRLELWRSFARRSQRLVARYRSTRRSALLRAPLIQTGVMGFRAPDTLVFRDDTIDGSTTVITGARGRVAPNRKLDRLAVSASADDGHPALAWTNAKLLALFTPGDGSVLADDARLAAPRRRIPTLEILPPGRRAIRSRLRAVTATLDPASGAIASILIQEAQGDELRLELTDHRQDPSDDELSRVLGS